MLIDELDSFLQENVIEIAVLTVPRQAVAEIAKVLVANNVKAILNFAHTDLNLPADVIVENVHLADSLMKLSYNINCRQKEHKEE